jgi:hypothetical protein
MTKLPLVQQIRMLLIQPKPQNLLGRLRRFRKRTQLCAELRAAWGERAPRA